MGYTRSSDANEITARSMMPSLEKEGTPGVVKFKKSVENELRFIMSSTGFSKVSDIDDSAIY
jgi:isopentenyl diphosphate isomerase/L-lactate dehydrogenase-like FMN-dependent dehydrogenase